MDDLEGEIRQLIAEIVEMEPENLSPEADFIKDLGLDSLRALEVLAALERRYRIQIPQERLLELTSLRRVVQVTREVLAQAQGAA
ncbi:MAG: acyl carrier protein [Acetobacteraceae bacterium]|nr:acyl carrier protein [Acetobacteraceae bacterium]